MPFPGDATPFIVERLLARLKAAGCVRGHFTANGATPPFSLAGELAGGAPAAEDISDDEVLNRLVGACFASYYSSAHACLTIDVDVCTGRSVLAGLTPAQVAARARTEQERQAAGKKGPLRPRSPFGHELAGQVAAALSRGLALMPYHRDYCGMGLEHHSGYFCYGEVWDGQYLEPQLAFSSREDFVSWLAQQSNKSLARLEETDAWYWHNQTITRQRLQEFVQP